MATVNLYVDVLARRAIRSPTSASPAIRPDFRDPTTHTLNIYFMRRNDATTENYSYQRFAGATPKAVLRRRKPPDSGTFILTIAGVDSPPIDVTLRNSGIAALIGATSSVNGADNVVVSGNAADGWTVEFTGDLAGLSQPAMSGRMTKGEVVVKVIANGGNGTNAKQSVTVRDLPLATATGWTELTSGGQYGWSATIDASTIPQSAWEKGDLVLEITLDAVNVRTGTDGQTSLQGTTRSGSDGNVVAVAAETGRTAVAMQDASGTSYLVAQNGSANYGKKFTSDDVGRNVSNNLWIAESTYIARVIDTPAFNAAVLNIPFSAGFTGEVPPNPTHFDLGGYPSRVYKSATANFTAADVGLSFSGTDIPTGTVIESLIDSQTVKLSQWPLKTGSGKSWTITARASNVFTSASANFTSADVGARLESPQLPNGTRIVSVISSTQVALSQSALGAASGQSWTLRPRSGFAGPNVSQLIPGTQTSKETQRITLTQQPVGGYITIQDGAGGAMPVVAVPAPVTAQNLQAALNSAYPNWNGVTVNEIVKGGTFDVVFNVYGKQRVLLVDESNAIYEPRVAVVPLGEPVSTPDAAPATQTPASRYLANNLIYFGVPNTSWLVRLSQPIVTEVPDGTHGHEVRIRYAQVYDQVFQNSSPIDVGSKPPDAPTWNAYFDHADTIEDRAGVRIYDWVGYKKPPNRTEVIQQQRAVYIVPIQLLNGFLVDMQLASVSMSTWVNANYTYYLFDSPPALPVDGPFGSVIHFAAIPGFQAQEFGWFGNGFGGPYQDGGGWHAGSGTLSRNFVLSWARRRWKSNIWEQVTYVG